MSNGINKLIGLGPRFCAWGLSKTIGLHAGTKPVRNSLGSRPMLVVGREDRVWNRPLTSLAVTPHLELVTINAEVADFHPRTTKEVLSKMAEYLKAWGHEPVADYFFRFAGQTYGNVVNTSEARSLFLRIAYQGQPLVKIDRQIVRGKVRQPLNDIFHPSRFVRYGIDTLLIKLGNYFGSPRSFVILPVFDADGAAIGKVNIGLRDTVSLSQEKLEVLRLLSEKIKTVSRDDDESNRAIDMEEVRRFVKHLRETPVYKYFPLLVTPDLAEGTSQLVNLLNDSMEKSLAGHAKRARDKDQWYRQMFEMLANAIEARESYTGGHCVRVAKIAEALGNFLPKELWLEEIKRAGVTESDPDQIIQRLKELLYHHILIHDLGKIGIRDDILNKAGHLKDDEFAEIKKHPTIGAEVIRRAMERYPRNPMLDQSALDAVLLHHVDYDGRGYPLSQLKGKQLPLVARLARVVDSFHTMVSRRSYKPAMSPDAVLNELIKGVGTSYDPKIIRATLELFSRTDRESEADTDFMIEEIIGVLETVTDPAQRALPEQVMAKLRGGSSVADLVPLVESGLAKGKVLPEAAEQFKQMIGKVEVKRAALGYHAARSLQFYDSVLGRATGIISEYSNSEKYNPVAVRIFIEELFANWVTSSDGSFIELVQAAFNAPDKKEQLADLSRFFFRHLS